MKRRKRASTALCAAVLGLACVARPVLPASVASPADGAVPLPCAKGWEARLLLDNGATGVWTVGAYPVFAQYAGNQVVGLDDAGVCHVLVSYGGKWTHFPRVHDGLWLGGLAHGEVDPRVSGAELYVGGEAGNAYQVRAWSHGALDAQLIAHLPGLALHTLVAGELDPRSLGPEVLAFTDPGALFRLSPTGEHGRFVTEPLGELPGRVRDALLLPGAGAGPAEIVTAGREGRLGLLVIDAAGPRWTEIARVETGIARLALRDSAPGEALVVYSGLDDGRVLRHERSATGWKTETIHVGPEGLRGLAAGRFHADPALESVAVFGYSAVVTLLSRDASGSWSAEPLFEDRDRGHWLAAVELDGRNDTRELLGSGYGGRIFLLTRAP